MATSKPTRKMLPKKTGKPSCIKIKKPTIIKMGDSIINNKIAATLLIILFN